MDLCVLGWWGPICKEFNNNTHYSFDGRRAKEQNYNVKIGITNGARRQTQMDAKMREQLFGVLGIEVGDDKR